MSTILNVLRKPRYAFVAIAVSVILSVLFWLLTFYFTPTPLPAYIQNYGILFTVTTVTLGTAIAILTGINTSMVICRKQMTGGLGFGKGTTSNICSAVTGAVASGCPICTAPLLGVFGLGGALALLPFQGLELKTIAIVALGISLYYTSKNVKITCKM
ncbi:MAG: hypothetical protein LV477_09910 [Candidatus Nitrosotalea sp.]|nr:hypothetical protein [Candidatus Nitrosotalea sp.]